MTFEIYCDNRLFFSKFNIYLLQENGKATCNKRNKTSLTLDFSIQHKTYFVKHTFTAKIKNKITI
jgi:hypothetical protein